MDPYQAIPYTSHSFPETHPEQLAALAQLFGVTAPDPLQGRLLELGCASGGNLIPLAWYLPNAQLVGVELSPSQAEAGRRRIQALGLDNCEILTGDATTLDLGNQGFDYVVVQGLYSWIPAPARNHLLGQIRRQLRPNGVAYLSFNALPGWRMRGMVRDILRYHVQDETTAQDQLAAARELFPFLQTCLDGLDALSARYLRHELTLLEQAPDSYLYHEFLADINDAQLFSDFVAAARAQGLRYLCNAELRYQLPAMLGDRARTALEAIPDPIERQQYLDFVLNRNFHQALLIPAELPCRPEPDYQAFGRLAFHADLSAPPRLELRKARAQPFLGPDGQSHAVTHPLTKAALAGLAEVYPAAVLFPDLEAQARRLVQSQGDARLAAQGEHLFGELFKLFAEGLVGATPQPGGAMPAPDLCPRASALALDEAAQGRLVDRRHRTLILDQTSAALVAKLDGRHDRTELAQYAAGPPDRRRRSTLVGSPEVDMLLARLARLGVFQPGN